MRVARTRAELVNALKELRSRRAKVGLVPTMGALHAGHMSLVQHAKDHCDAVVVSIFVNPTQFGPAEDFAKYPRTPEKDCELLNRSGVQLAFLPGVSDVYRQTTQVSVNPGPVADTFEGAARPGHFAGVLTVVAKFFNLIQPDVAVFGQKDAQQLYLIRKMVADLDFPSEIIEAETIRESDGLAMSSRNAYLKVDERSRASVLYRALEAGRSAILQGISQRSVIKDRMTEKLQEQPGFRWEYLTVVDEGTFMEQETVQIPCRVIGAVGVGSVRLIDNLSVR